MIIHEEKGMRKGIENKVVVVTGASAGIGKATAEFFAARGAKVVCLARRKVDGMESISTDVTDREAVKTAIDAIVAEHGRIDVLVNNAGMGISGTVEDTDPTAVRKIFELNFFGLLNVIQTVLPVMRAQGGGTIVNVSSVAGKLAIPFQSFYSATKAAVSSLTAALRAEVAPFGIKVTSVLPGDVKTDFTAAREKNSYDNPAYGERVRHAVEAMERDEQNGMSPSVIARDIYRLAASKNPPVGKVGGAKYAFLTGIAKCLPERAVCYLLGKLYG